MTDSRRPSRRRARHQLAIAAVAGAAALSACTTAAETAPVNDVGGAADNTATTTITTIPTGSFPPTTINATTITPTTATIPPTTIPTTTTTTTVPEVLDVFDPNCVTLAETGGSLEAVGVARGIDDPTGLWFENDQIDAVAPGDLIDICLDNGVNDIDGQPRPPIDDAARGAALAANVERQQSKLNELFSG
ncbi:MAG: hypothetical protein HKN07_13420, partial [Acidimicrobiia bacterium]|nr:hypothetical protein [Acidimicrobiia bacterium]